MSPLACLYRWRAPMVVAAGLLAIVTVVRAEEVRVTVVAILATRRDTAVDPKLEGVARQVRKKEPGLTGFRLAHVACKSVTVGSKENFALVDDQTAAITVRHGANKNNRVGLTVKAPRVGEITYTTCCGKFFPIVTRYRTKDQDRLIVAVRVQPCKK